MRYAAHFLILAFLSSCSRDPQGAPPSSLTPQPRPSPARPKPRPTRPPQGLEIVTPVTDLDLEPTPTPELNFVPSNKHLLEEVAFKSEAEVLELLGEPDQRLKQGELGSWYYLREEPGSKGKRVCPEVRFMEGSARMVIFWTPEAMRSRISEARLLEASGETKAPASFTFMDGFKHLGVGTSRDAVLTDLGEPDAKRQVGDAEEWDYETLIVEYGAKRKMTVKIRDNKVIEVRGR